MFDIKPGTICANVRHKQDENGDDIHHFVKKPNPAYSGKEHEFKEYDAIEYENDWECAHEASGAWTGSGGMIGAVHGQWAAWCKCCMVKAQIEYSEKAASRLPELKKELEGVTCGD